MFDHLPKDFQDIMQPELTNTCERTRVKAGWGWYIKNKSINNGFKFWSCCGSKSRYVQQFDKFLEKKENTQFGLGGLVVLLLCESQQDTFKITSIKEIQ